MVYFVRTVSVNGSKTKEAIEWAYKVADFVKSKHGTEVELLMNVTGSQSEIKWLARAESVGDFEKLMAQLLANPDYQQLLLDAQGLLVDGSVRDNYFRSVPRT